MSVDTDRRPAGTTAPEPGAPASPDIYALLGVSRQASPALARQLYWVRVEEYQQARERDEPGAAEAIEALNEALAIILDDRRRAEYDRAHRAALRGAADARAATESGVRTRAGIVLAIMLGTVGAGLWAAGWAGPVTLATVLLAGMLVLVVAVALPRRATPDAAFTLLGLRADAGLREADIAYELAVQELLTRVKFDPDVLRRLERLDQAYIQATRILAEREGSAGPRARGFAARLTIAAIRVFGAVLKPLVRFLGGIALALGLWLARLILRASRLVDARLRTSSGLGIQRAAEYFVALSRQVQRTPEEEPPPLALGSDRRAALGLDPLRRARDADDTGGRGQGATAALARVVPLAPPDDDLLEAYVVLQSSAGNRRVPIGAAPLRIGSGDTCDLVLPAHLGLAPEHALLWQRDGFVLMHVIDPAAASCLVNDRPMTWASLEDGDVIQLAKARLTIEVPPAAA